MSSTTTGLSLANPNRTRYDAAELSGSQSTASSYDNEGDSGSAA